MAHMLPVRLAKLAKRGTYRQTLFFELCVKYSLAAILGLMDSHSPKYIYIDIDVYIYMYTYIFWFRVQGLGY